MEIVIASPGMSMGPTTLQYKSLGGSETAALMLAKELASIGHLVTLFCHLPPEGQVDHYPGGVHADKVRYSPIEHYQRFIESTEVDLLIASRSPQLLAVGHQAKKAVLWCHDLATHSTKQGVMNVAFNFNEMWVVSEYHKNQINSVLGYPLNRIHVVRNGIVKFDDLDTTPIRDRNTLLYSSRPERGLHGLVRPGGIMDRLPEFKLKVTMYDNFPEHMRGYYEQLFRWCQERPNVEMLGVKTQRELRELMSESTAYIYPTNFEEVSCIIARECIEQRLPFITTGHGALRETLGDCGLYGPEVSDYNSDDQAQAFADYVRSVLSNGTSDAIAEVMEKRDDLYWDGPAITVTNLGSNRPDANDYSWLFSLIEDSDIIPALAIIDNIEGAQHLKDQLYINYPFLTGDCTFEEYYARWFKYEDNLSNRRNPLGYSAVLQSSRFRAIHEWVSKFPEGTTFLDYGCAEGTISLNLAKMFPNHKFIGMDFQQSNIDFATKFAAENETPNWRGIQGDATKEGISVEVDAVICTEVLEHVLEPWKLLQALEDGVKEGTPFLITTPQGPWEMLGLRKKEQWYWRNHIWHIDKWMTRRMLKDKAGLAMSSYVDGKSRWVRNIGHLVTTYNSGGPVHPIDPVEKALAHHSRQTVTACIICKNGEESILRTLNSIDPDVQAIHIAWGNTTDQSQKMVDNWIKERPWVDYKAIHVQDVKAGEFGFDDARNASISLAETDWILWIDTDEYLSAPTFSGYLKDNAFDAYAVHQHHFTCDPRGTPAMIDKPARLFRNGIGFKFYGKVHEHAEIGFNEGPGFTYMLPNVDIGHVGYVNEVIRRGRFGRNYPLLLWDREVNPERKLGKFLWLRDLVHEMRMREENGDHAGARDAAQRAIDFYKKEKDSMIGVGGGSASPLQYQSEALKFLGRGHEVAVNIRIGDEEVQAGGIFESFDDLLQEMKTFLEAHKEKVESRYYR